MPGGWRILESGPLQDVQKAILLIRQNAASWKVDVDKVGIIGFSAGGHLAATAATRFQENLLPGALKGSLRPNFQILIYPVISFADSITHLGSREQLIGKNPSAEVIKKFSAEQNVSAETPPCLLVHCQTDDVVSYQNAEIYYRALLQHKVAADLHMYSMGEHGFGTRKTGLPVDGWLNLVRDWVEAL